MFEKSCQWAKARGLVRTNPVHGEKEAKLILEGFFKNTNEGGEVQQIQGQAEVEDPIASSITLCLSQPLILQTKFGKFLFTLNAALLLFWDLVRMVVR